MSLRAMNNTEKAAAKILKENGFHVFWQYQGENRGDYWATHPKFICQYHIGTCCKSALDDLEKLTVRKLAFVADHKEINCQT